MTTARSRTGDVRTISRVIDQGHGYLLPLTSGEQEVGARVSMYPCADPECECRDLRIVLAPADKGGWAEPHDEIHALVNLDTGELADFPVGCTPALRTSLESQLVGDFLELLRERWRRVKRIHDPDAWRKQDWSWWEPALFVAWQDAFPGELDDVVVVDGRRYLVDERYCCSPACSCGDVLLDFVDLEDENDSAATPQMYVSMSAWRPGTEEGEPLSSDLVPYWQAYSALPGVKKRLSERRRKLRRIGRELYRDFEDSPPVAQAKTKLGRNAPCPCGSGKKYKRCCGRA